MNKEVSGNIVLIGMPTSGKSTAGVILAKILGLDFVDTDLLLQKRTGKKLKDILSEDGLETFLKTEEEVCRSLAVSDAVVATGGSVVYGAGAMEHLKRIGTVVYLKIDFATLKERLHNARQRGVVLKEGQSIEDLFWERTALYERYADIIIAENGQGIEETVEKIAESVGRRQEP